MARRRTRGRRRRPRRRAATWLDPRLAFGLVLFAVAVWLAFAAFQDRHWRAFDQAGDGAYGRGNYDYAERMYDAALQEARSRERRDLMAASLMDLSRTYAAQGRHDLARIAAEQAQLARRR